MPYCRSEFSAPWGLALPSLQRCLMFHIALSSLQERDIPLAAQAERLGYQSEAAFSRAFKRFVGMWPGAARKQASSGAMEHDTTRGKTTA